MPTGICRCCLQLSTCVHEAEELVPGSPSPYTKPFQLTKLKFVSTERRFSVKRSPGQGGSECSQGPPSPPRRCPSPCDALGPTGTTFGGSELTRRSLSRDGGGEGRGPLCTDTQGGPGLRWPQRPELRKSGSRIQGPVDRRKPTPGPPDKPRVCPSQGKPGA